MKKALSLFAVLVLLVGLLPAGAVSFVASADVSGDFTYSVSDGEATITEYTGSAKTLEIPSELGGYPVRNIGSSAFFCCDSLTSVVIPDGVTSIGDEAFFLCTGLTSVTIPDSVTSIGSRAFERCWSLASVKLPDRVTSLGPGAFQGCIGLTSVTLSNGLTSIEASVFSDCDHLVSITIPESVTSIGDYAFNGCWSLVSITVPNSVTSVGDYAFYECSKLESVTLSSGVTSVGDYAFCYCDKLKDLTLSNSVRSIGEKAFDWFDIDDVWYQGSREDRANIQMGQENEAFDRPIWHYDVCTTPHIYSSSCDVACNQCGFQRAVQTEHTFSNATDSTCNRCGEGRYYTYTIRDGGVAVITQYTGSETALSIPASLDGYLVVSVGQTAFKENTALREVTIGENVADIEEHAFFGCTGLRKLTLGDRVTSIGYYAFYKCTGLTSVTFPNSVTSIRDYAFYGCTGLTSVTIPDRVTSIGSGVFSFCTGLTSVTIPDSVKSIGNEAFYYCTGLASITIPDGVTSIGYKVFDGCTGLTTITIPDSVMSVDAFAFNGCSRLISVFYEGDEADRAAVAVDTGNGCLADANWYYNACYYSGRHKFDNGCDATCNICYKTRTAKHTYETVKTKATLSCNGSIVTKCTGCGDVTAEAKIYYPKIITLSTETYTYNGKVRTPRVTVTNSIYQTLREGTDYTVSYASGRKKVGTYKVTVKMKGDYSGTKTLTFTIKPIDVSKCKISLSTTSYTYDGKVKSPSVTVKNANGTKLTKNTHYTVTYASGRKYVGKYKVTIKMKGNYSGTKTLYFTVNPVKTTVKSLTAGKKSLKVAVTKKSAQVSGYQIQYSTSKKFTSAKTKTLSSYKTTSYTLKSLKAKTTYYVRVRTYKMVDGVKYYSGWSSYKYKKTK